MGAHIRLVSNTGEDVLCLVGPGGAKLTGGVGGTQTVDIPRATQAVTWLSHPPYGMTLSLMLDGHAAKQSIESDLNAIYRMARAEPGVVRPPSVSLSGPVPRTDLAWLIEQIDEDESSTIRRPSDDFRTRQVVTLTLVQNRDVQLVVPASQANRAKRPRIVVFRQGDTLGKIAHRYHVTGGAKAIQKLNHVRDPKRIKPGTKLRLP
jgi:LysM repeat protein